MLQQLIKPFIFSSALVVILWVVARSIIKKYFEEKLSPFYKEVFIITFLIYIACLLCITLFPITIVTSKAPVYKKLNFIPVVYSIHQYKAAFYGTLGYLKEQFLRNLFGNIILFIPFGIFLPLISRYKTLGKTLLLALLLSVTLEALQFIAIYFHVYRSVDIDDVLLNVTGAALGFFIYILIMRAAKTFSELSGF